MKVVKQTASTSFSGFVFEVGSILEEEMGGSSGSLLSILFTAMAAEIRLAGEDISLKVVSRALKSGIDEMMHVGRAQQGDRTMLDALIPAQQAMINSNNLKSALQAAADAAFDGSQQTATMVAKA